MNYRQGLMTTTLLVFSLALMLGIVWVLKELSRLADWVVDKYGDGVVYIIFAVVILTAVFFISSMVDLDEKSEDDRIGDEYGL